MIVETNRHSAETEHDSAPAKTRIAIVAASVHHGNTSRIAAAMAEVLNAKLLSPDEITPDRLANFDLVGFGSGIYFGQHSATLRKLVNTVTTVPHSAFIFSTAGLPCFARWFHWPLRRAITKRGIRIVGEFSCRGWDTFGPLCLMGGINRRHPNERDINRARQFARGLRLMDAPSQS